MRLVHVECNLSQLQQKESSNTGFSVKNKAVLGERTAPFCLIFANGNLMLLWSKPGKEYKYWTRAF